MANSKHDPVSQGTIDNASAFVDPETGEILGEVQSDAERMFEPGEGRQDDGSIGLPKITMATIRALPERCKAIGEHGDKIKIAAFSGIASGTVQTEKRDTGEIFFGLTGDFVAIRYDNNGEPDAIYKSDTIYLPIGHKAALEKIAKTGHLQFALEFWAQPANNPVGYSWSYRNLAKIDRDNLSAIDRLAILSVEAGRRMSAAPVGLLAELRREPQRRITAAE